MHHFASFLVCCLLAMVLVRAQPNLSVEDQAAFNAWAYKLVQIGQGTANVFCTPDIVPDAATCFGTLDGVQTVCRDIIRSISNAVAITVVNMDTKFCNLNNKAISWDQTRNNWAYDVFTKGNDNYFMLMRVCVTGVATCDGITPTTTTSTTTTTTPTTTTSTSTTSTTTTTTTTTLVLGHVTSLQICQLLNNITPFVTPSISQICVPTNQAVIINYVAPFGPILTDTFSKAIIKGCVNNATGYADLLDFYVKEVCTKVVCTIASC